MRIFERVVFCSIWNFVSFLVDIQRLRFIRRSIMGGRFLLIVFGLFGTVCLRLERYRFFTGLVIVMNSCRVQVRSRCIIIESSVNSNMFVGRITRCNFNRSFVLNIFFGRQYTHRTRGRDSFRYVLSACRRVTRRAAVAFICSRCRSFTICRVGVILQGVFPNLSIQRLLGENRGRTIIIVHAFRFTRRSNYVLHVLGHFIFSHGSAVFIRQLRTRLSTIR